jgi:hypothetical protein
MPWRLPFFDHTHVTDIDLAPCSLREFFQLLAILKIPSLDSHGQPVILFALS